VSFQVPGFSGWCKGVFGEGFGFDGDEVRRCGVGSAV